MKNISRTTIYLLLLLVNICVAVALLVSYTASFTDPRSNWFIAFVGLAYPVLFIVNLLFLGFWLFVKRVLSLISGVAILIGIRTLFTFVSFDSYNDEIPKDAIKVMSYNVRNFDVYNYKPNWQFNYTNRDKILNLLAEQQPDIVCMQEYFYESSHKFKTTDTLVDILNAKNSHVEFVRSNRNTNFFGMATFTKYPIIKRGRIYFVNKSGNFLMFTDVVIRKDTVRIYNVHLESIRLSPEDYQFAEKVKTGTSDEDEGYIKKGSLRIFKRLHAAFERRAMQAEILAEELKKCPYPTILCGDFNDTPSSYCYNLVAKCLEDSFVESGKGLGQSYAGKSIPSFRIDYIFHSKQFESLNYLTIKEAYSDHYPVECLIVPVDK